jgi:hypothetical protein
LNVRRGKIVNSRQSAGGRLDRITLGQRRKAALKERGKAGIT